MSNPGPTARLPRFVSSARDEARWSKSAWEGREGIRLVAPPWKSGTWEHDVVLCRPRGRTSDVWVLHITGWEPNAFDVDWSQGLADMCGHNVAVLFQVPNQPLWGRTEDDLVAHTFEQFLETGDPDWPLLFPMVRSVLCTMDALEEHERSILRFVPFGASKRGWTSWLCSGVKDPRIIGVAPMLFDNLLMPAQLAKQHQDWGEFSPRIVDYTSRDLQSKTESGRGLELVAMVDPASYVSAAHVPVLLVHGANDPYWTVDAVTVYWHLLPDDRWAVTVPNLGHAFDRTEWWTPTLAAFVRHCALRSEGAKGWCRPTPLTSETWRAVSADRCFESSVWTREELDQPEGWVAAFMADFYEWDGLRFWLTSPPTVSRLNSR